MCGELVDPVRELGLCSDYNTFLQDVELDTHCLPLAIRGKIQANFLREFSSDIRKVFRCLIVSVPSCLLVYLNLISQKSNDEQIIAKYLSSTFRVIGT